MNDLTWVEAGLLAVLLWLDVLTAAARASLLNINLAHLLTQRERRERQVNRVLALTHATPRLRTTFILAQTLWRFLAAGLVIALLNRPLSTPWALLETLGVLALLALGVSWLEGLVRLMVARAVELWALRLSAYARLLMIAFTPFTICPFVLTPSSNSAVEPDAAITEDDLKSMVDAGQAEGVLEQDERKMIYSIFKLGDTLAREIMVPRIDMNTLDIATPLPEAVEAVIRAGHSRIPVFEDTVDTIRGVLYARDLLQVYRDGAQGRTLADLIRPAYFIPEAKKVDELMAEMQSNHVHMALVVDEYGGIAGLVTLEDIVEEIIGEIQDEYDQAEESPYQQVGEGEYIFQGRVDLEEFNEIMGSALPQDEAETLGGFVYSRMGRVPLEGESISVGNLLLTMEQVSGRRIRKIRAAWVSDTPKESAENEGIDD